MDKPKVKICNHFNHRKLNNFKSKVMSREDLYCDSCFPTPPKPTTYPEEGLNLGNLLMCLGCFEINCNRQTKNQCMLKHGENSKHHVTYSLGNGSVWCYMCDYELKEKLIMTPKGEDEGQNRKLDKLREYLEQVDKCFQALKKQQQEREIMKQNQIEEENPEESNEVEIIEKVNPKRRASNSRFRLTQRTVPNKAPGFWPE